MEKLDYCLICNKDISQATSIKHFSDCSGQKFNNTNEPLLLLKVSSNTHESYDDYTVDKDTFFCIYLIINPAENFSSLGDLIKTVWFKCECPKHVFNFKNNKHENIYNNLCINGITKIDNTKISNVLRKKKDYVFYEYDGILTTIAKITFVDIINVNIKNNNVKVDHVNQIVGQNKQSKLKCTFCNLAGIENVYCIICKKLICNKCISESKHICKQIKANSIIDNFNNITDENYHNKHIFNSLHQIINDPRSGISCLNFNNYKIGKLANDAYMQIQY